MADGARHPPGLADLGQFQENHSRKRTKTFNAQPSTFNSGVQNPATVLLEPFEPPHRLFRVAAFGSPA
jgi:hypothetical protein